MRLKSFLPRLLTAALLLGLTGSAFAQSGATGNIEGS